MAEKKNRSSFETVNARVSAYHAFCARNACATCPARTRSGCNDRDESCYSIWLDLPNEGDRA